MLTLLFVVIGLVGLALLVRQAHRAGTGTDEPLGTAGAARCRWSSSSAMCWWQWA